MCLSPRPCGTSKKMNRLVLTLVSFRYPIFVSSSVMTELPSGKLWSNKEALVHKYQTLSSCADFNKKHAFFILVWFA